MSDIVVSVFQGITVASMGIGMDDNDAKRSSAGLYVLVAAALVILLLVVAFGPGWGLR